MSYLSRVKLNRNGFTLIELMVAVALFVVVMTISIALFNRTIESQQGTVASKELYESGDYALRFMAYEISGAQEELAGCGGCDSSSRYFCNTGGTVYFKNRDGVCERFEQNTDEQGIGRIGLWRGEDVKYLTPSGVSISGLLFDFQEMPDPALPGRKITARFTASPVADKDIAPVNLQTSVYVASSPFVCGQTITDRDNYRYQTVQIGNQCWLAENLRTKTKYDGTCINDGFSPPCPDANAGDSGFGRACYDNDESSCTSNGALYTLPGAMLPDHHEGEQGICPLGWHMPTDAEWHELEAYLTDPGNLCDPDRSGTGDCSSAGTKLQLTGDFDFKGILAGYRDSTFHEEGSSGYFWSSSDTGTDTAWSRSISSGSDVVERRNPKGGLSFSVRCIRN